MEVLLVSPVKPLFIILAKAVPSQAERKVLVESFRRAIDAAECIIEHGCQKAMNDFN